MNKNIDNQPLISQQEIDKMAKIIKGLEGKGFLTEVDSIIESYELEKHKGKFYSILLSEIDICKKQLRIDNGVKRQTRLYSVLLKYSVRIRKGEFGDLIVPKLSGELTSRVNKTLQQENSTMKDWFTTLLGKMNMTDYNNLLNIFLLNDVETTKQLCNTKNIGNMFLMGNITAPEFISVINEIKGINKSGDEIMQAFENDMRLLRYGGN